MYPNEAAEEGVDTKGEEREEGNESEDEGEVVEEEKEREEEGEEEDEVQLDGVVGKEEDREESMSEGVEESAVVCSEANYVQASLIGGKGNVSSMMVEAGTNAWGEWLKTGKLAAIFAKHQQVLELIVANKGGNKFKIPHVHHVQQ